MPGRGMNEFVANFLADMLTVDVSGCDVMTWCTVLPNLFLKFALQNVIIVQYFAHDHLPAAHSMLSKP